MYKLFAYECICVSFKLGMWFRNGKNVVISVVRFVCGIYIGYASVLCTQCLAVASFIQKRSSLRSRGASGLFPVTPCGVVHGGCSLPTAYTPASIPLRALAYHTGEVDHVLWGQSPACHAGGMDFAVGRCLSNNDAVCFICGVVDT